MKSLPKLPAIPSILGIEEPLARILEPIKEILELTTGQRGPRNATWINNESLPNRVQQALDQNLITISTSNLTTDVLIPLAPEGLLATGALATVLLSWTPPAFAGVAHTEIWCSSTNDLSTGVMIGTTTAVLYVDSPGSTDTTYYYWIRFISSSAHPGPFNTGALLGTSATTLDVGTAQIAANAVTVLENLYNSLTTEFAYVATTLITDSLAINSSGAPILCYFGFAIDSYVSAFTINLTRDATVLRTWSFAALTQLPYRIGGVLLDQPGIGSFTYTVTVTAGDVTISERTLLLLEIKR